MVARQYMSSLGPWPPWNDIVHEGLHLMCQQHTGQNVLFSVTPPPTFILGKNINPAHMALKAALVSPTQDRYYTLKNNNRPTNYDLYNQVGALCLIDV